MSQVFYSPLGALNQLHRELGRVFDETSSSEPTLYESSNWVPQVDITETENGFHVTVDIPGVPPEDVEVTHEKNVLSIRGQRSTKSEEEGAGYKRRERVTGSFLRQFTLPDSADEEKISARITNGVLDIHIPKGTANEPRKIVVQG
jgi:HSP20 family protein